jgi:GNAT superfamily N-acetyltransferase
VREPDGSRTALTAGTPERRSESVPFVAWALDLRGERSRGKGAPVRVRSGGGLLYPQTLSAVQFALGTREGGRGIRQVLSPSCSCEHPRMQAIIRSYRADDVASIIEFSLRAWGPVHSSFEQIIGPEVFRALYESDWRVRQAQDIRSGLSADRSAAWVAEVDARPVGFVVAILKPDDDLGVIQLLAVDPDYQNGGVGGALTDVATEWITESGLGVAAISTGGDVSHAAARHVYERAGYTAVPSVNYFKALRS